MTATRPARAPQPRRRLRVVRGRGGRRGSFAPFVMFGTVVIVSMIGLVVARTSLDAGAFDLTEMNRQIEVEESRQELLSLDVARLESPGRIAPMAVELGMVLPDERLVLLVDEPLPAGTSDPWQGDIGRLALGSVEDAGE